MPDIKLKFGGFIKRAYAGQPISGRDADLIIIDDPISPSQARDPLRCKAVNDWFESDALTRLNDKSAGSVLLIMQRVHPDDLSGHIRYRQGMFKHLILSAIAMQDERWVLSDGRILTRAKQDLLDPIRENFDQLKSRLYELGSFQFNAQYLQGLFSPFVEKKEIGIWLWEQLLPDAIGHEGFVAASISFVTNIVFFIMSLACHTPGRKWLDKIPSIRLHRRQSEMPGGFNTSGCSLQMHPPKSGTSTTGNTHAAKRANFPM